MNTSMKIVTFLSSDFTESKPKTYWSHLNLIIYLFELSFLRYAQSFTKYMMFKTTIFA